MHLFIRNFEWVSLRTASYYSFLQFKYRESINCNIILNAMPHVLISHTYNICMTLITFRHQEQFKYIPLQFQYLRDLDFKLLVYFRPLQSFSSRIIVYRHKCQLNDMSPKACKWQIESMFCDLPESGLRV